MKLGNGPVRGLVMQCDNIRVYHGALSLTRAVTRINIKVTSRYILSQDFALFLHTQSHQSNYDGTCKSEVAYERQNAANFVTK